MTSSNANARAVGSSSIHKFPWKWYLSDLANVTKNGLTVFSCFSCGGGSSMGYKLAGYDVIGNVEIDPRVMEVYRKNNHPKYPYLMDVRDFLKIPDADLPKELFHLDILDGSPPCSVFSTAGEREKGWNKEKVFREGQAKQKLDDLFFYFIRIAEKLKPRVVIAENVSGLLKGNAKGYVNEIFKAFDAAGYKTQLFLLNAAFMGVPQKRERCFFVAQRKDQSFPKLELKFDEKPILFGEIRQKDGDTSRPTELRARVQKYYKPGDHAVDDINRRIGKTGGYTNPIVTDTEISPTITANGQIFRAADRTHYASLDFVSATTFPQDYDFNAEEPQYICGMSVPPVMMAQVSTAVYEQWFNCGVIHHCERKV
jgi:DNA (cytosine-5)-methyltransferase 1